MIAYKIQPVLHLTNACSISYPREGVEDEDVSFYDLTVVNKITARDLGSGLGRSACHEAHWSVSASKRTASECTD